MKLFSLIRGATDNWNIGALKIWHGTKSKLGYTVLTAIAEIFRAQVSAKHPDWTLPSTDQILAFGGGLVACHTVTDVVSLLTDGFVAYRQTRKV